jgi:hypothetical protein
MLKLARLFADLGLRIADWTVFGSRLSQVSQSAIRNRQSAICNNYTAVAPFIQLEYLSLKIIGSCFN